MPQEVSAGVGTGLFREPPVEVPDTTSLGPEGIIEVECFLAVDKLLAVGGPQG